MRFFNIYVWVLYKSYWLLVTGYWFFTEYRLPNTEYRVAGCCSNFKFQISTFLFKISGVFETQTSSYLSNWGTKKFVTWLREFLIKDDFEAKLLHLKKK